MNIVTKLRLLNIVLLINCTPLFAQKADTRDLNLFYSSGLFIQNKNAVENDSIIVVNDDTFFVSVNKLGLVLLEVKIYNKSESVIENYKTWNYQKEGEHKFYYGSGKLKSISYFHEGKLIAPEMGYYETGELKYIYDIKFNPNIDSFKKIGFHTDYYENGNIKMHAFFSDTSDSSIVFYYFDSGKLKGKSFGLMDNQKYYEYYENGNLKKEGNFNQDIQFPQGKWLEYYPTGKIKSIKYYKFVDMSSFPVGEWIYFNENGRELRREIKTNSETVK